MIKYYPKHAVVMMITWAIVFGVAITTIFNNPGVDLEELVVPVVGLGVSIGVFIKVWVSVTGWYKYWDDRYDVVKKEEQDQR